MRFALVGLAALLFQETQDAPGQPPLMLEIAARGYLAGGRAGSMAGDSAVDRVDSYVWVDQTLCSMGAGNDAPSNTPWAGWHFTGDVASRSADELVVNVEWQRIWENGRRLPGGNAQNRAVRIRAGERVDLDRLAPGSAGSCNMTEARLEVSVMARAAYLMGVAGGVRGGRAGGVGRGTAAQGAAGGVGTGATGGVARGVTGGGQGSGAQAGGVQGRGVQGGTQQASTATAAQAGRGGRGSAQGLAGAGAEARPASGAVRGVMQVFFPERYVAEVWLVHKRPDGTETVQQQTLRFGTASAPFAFPPVDVAGRGGPITLDISGSIEMLSSTGQRYGLTTGYGGMAATAATGSAGGRGAGRGGAASTAAVAASSGSTSPSQLFGVSISRRARRANPFIDTRGATDISIQTPKPEDVLSFELPPLQKSTEDLLNGHTFSLRLRVSPIK